MGEGKGPVAARLGSCCVGIAAAGIAEGWWCVGGITARWSWAPDAAARCVTCCCWCCRLPVVAQWPPDRYSPLEASPPLPCCGCVCEWAVVWHRRIASGVWQRGASGQALRRRGEEWGRALLCHGRRMRCGVVALLLLLVLLVLLVWVWGSVVMLPWVGHRQGACGRGPMEGGETHVPLLG